MKLICFSHAGGMSYYYTFLQKAGFRDIDDVILYEYPLRGAKTHTPHFRDFNTCVDSIAEELAHSILNNDRYILFGHSFGAFVAYETAHILMERYKYPPELVIISGQKPPCIVDPEHYRCCEEEGVTFLKKLGGIPEHMWDYPEALQYFTNLCVADLRVLQTYNPSHEYPENKLPAGVVMYGKDDVEFNSEDLVYWNGYFKNLIEIKEFDGNHFYLGSLKKEVAEYMNLCITDLLNENKTGKEVVYI